MQPAANDEDDPFGFLAESNAEKADKSGFNFM